MIVKTVIGMLATLAQWNISVMSSLTTDVWRGCFFDYDVVTRALGSRQTDGQLYRRRRA